MSVESLYIAIDRPITWQKSSALIMVSPFMVNESDFERREPRRRKTDENVRRVARVSDVRLARFRFFSDVINLISKSLMLEWRNARPNKQRKSLKDLRPRVSDHHLLQIHA